MMGHVPRVKGQFHREQHLLMHLPIVTAAEPIGLKLVGMRVFHTIHIFGKSSAGNWDLAIP